jgi:isopenicillin-N N-acyltransferase-like protein
MQYGRNASVLIKKNITVYGDYFKYLAGLEWRQAKEHAIKYEPVIQAYRPHILEEMKGIAHGADVSFEDILALNVRTEIRNTAIARSLPGECTAFVVLPGRTNNDHTIVGQNWDWVTAVAETVILLEVELDHGPNFISVVEAGLIAKTGMNAAGIGLTTNALHSRLDRDAVPGIPYHVILRAILESKNLSQAILAITAQSRGSSANYLIAHRDGFAFNAETTPGDFSKAHISFPEGHTYTHTNHYLNNSIEFQDLASWYCPGSLIRHCKMDRYLRNHAGLISVEDMKNGLKDHFNFPESICTHPDPGDPEVDQFMTVASLVMDLDEKVIYLAAGNPCQSPYLEMDYSQFLR